MNERLKELALQAGWSGFESLDERNKRFAELIVRECAKISIGDDPSFTEAPILEDGARRMFKHFGVE